MTDMVATITATDRTGIDEGTTIVGMNGTNWIGPKERETENAPGVVAEIEATIVNEDEMRLGD